MRVAIIPARGGSKRIPRKNVKLFAGKPMMAHSISAAAASGLFDRIIVTTDDPEIAEVAKQHGAETPFVRPAELANDHAATIPVIAHAVQWLQERGAKLTAACCIYATAPFIQASDLKEGLKAFETGRWRYVFSATSFGFPIYRSIKRLPDGGVEMFYPEHFATRSQDLPEAYHDAGQFYWGKPEAWLEGGPLFDKTSTIVAIPRWRVQDIDTPEDWERAEVMWKTLRQMGSAPLMKCGVAIVGLGRVGLGYDLGLGPEKVFSHARAFATHPDFCLVSAVDPNPVAREDFRRAYGVEAAESIESLPEAGCDVAVIAVPTPDHGVALRAVLDKLKPKAVLCEKPLSYDLAEARRMVEACAASGAKLFVNFIRRAEPGAREVAERIRSGRVEGPLRGTAWYSKGFQHNGSHFVNLLQWWLGPVRESSVIKNGRMFDGRDPEPDVLLRFEKGEVVLMAAPEEAYSHYGVELVARNGRLRYDRGGESIEWQPAVAGDVAGYRRLSRDSERIAGDFGRYQFHVANELAKALRGEPAEICDGAEALRTAECVTKILEQRTK